MNKILTNLTFNELTIWQDTKKSGLPTIVEFDNYTVVYWPNGKMNNFRDAKLAKTLISDAFEIKVLNDRATEKLSKLLDS